MTSPTPVGHIYAYTCPLGGARQHLAPELHAGLLAHLLQLGNVLIHLVVVVREDDISSACGVLAAPGVLARDVAIKTWGLRHGANLNLCQLARRVLGLLPLSPHQLLRVLEVDIGFPARGGVD